MIFFKKNAVILSLEEISLWLEISSPPSFRKQGGGTLGIMKKQTNNNYPIILPLQIFCWYYWTFEIWRLAIWDISIIWQSSTCVLDKVNKNMRTAAHSFAVKCIWIDRNMSLIKDFFNHSLPWVNPAKQILLWGFHLSHFSFNCFKTKC